MNKIKRRLIKHMKQVMKDLIRDNVKQCKNANKSKVSKSINGKNKKKTYKMNN